LEKDPFRIRGHVADFDVIVDDIVTRSAVTRDTLPMLADIAYGQHATETVDLFFPRSRSESMPVHVFVHGGYWRMFSKRDYSYIGNTITEAGAIAVIVDYALMPAVRMEVLVDQVQRAMRWVFEHIAEYGGDPSRVTVSGHSAGAHLASFLCHRLINRPKPRAALLLSGLYDLEPLRSSFLQREIELTDEEVVKFSPLFHEFDPGIKVSVLVGADETPPFFQQADRFTRHLRSQGLTVDRFDAIDSNHMTSVRDLGLPDTQLATALFQTIQNA
jgi:arylformamidase